MKVFYADWASIPEADRSRYASKQFRRILDLENRLDTFAHRKTLTRLRAAVYAVEDLTMHLRTAGLPADAKDPRKWELYWVYADANFEFRVAARREMGLSRPEVPPGLARYRDRQVLTGRLPRVLRSVGQRARRLSR